MESTEPLTLQDALGLYVGGLKKKNDRAEQRQYLMKFVQWCGGDRQISEIKPPEVGEYGERALGATSGVQASEGLQEVRKFLAFAKKKGLTDTNLGLHLRIPKSTLRSRRRAAADGPQPVELTSGGHKQLLDELEKLKAERGPIADEIRRAAADKDVRENVPLEAAREHLGLVESRIAQIENTLKVAVVVDSRAKKGKAIRTGSQVTLKDLAGGRELKYMLVSALEASPLQGKISDVSPVGKALVNRTTGQEVEVDTPRGKQRYRIMRVK